MTNGSLPSVHSIGSGIPFILHSNHRIIGIMAMNPPKPRKRIVPQLLSSPTGTTKHKIDALSGPLQIDNLKEQYTQAKELLGPGRKIYVNLAPYQTEHKQVSWKRVGCCGMAHKRPVCN